MKLKELVALLLVALDGDTDLLPWDKELVQLKEHNFIDINASTFDLTPKGESFVEGLKSISRLL